MNIYIQAYDTDGAFTVFHVNHTVRVVPDVANLDTIIAKVIDGDPYFSSNVILHEGSFVASIQELQSVTALLNKRSLSDKMGLIAISTSESCFHPSSFHFYLNVNSQIKTKMRLVGLCFHKKMAHSKAIPV